MERRDSRCGSVEVLPLLHPAKASYCSAVRELPIQGNVPQFVVLFKTNVVLSLASLVLDIQASRTSNMSYHYHYHHPNISLKDVPYPDDHHLSTSVSWIHHLFFLFLLQSIEFFQSSQSCPQWLPPPRSV